ncbi:Ataxin-10 [Chytridiales sp. JEL 0842]|nr:Ataxin-10 [Chytridiales sp. JEL 0842]
MTDSTNQPISGNNSNNNTPNHLKALLQQAWTSLNIPVQCAKTDNLNPRCLLEVGSMDAGAAKLKEIAVILARDANARVAFTQPLSPTSTYSDSIRSTISTLSLLLRVTRNQLFLLFDPLGPCKPSNETQAHSALNLCLSAMQVVRNMCAGVQENQEGVVKGGLMEVGEEVVGYMCSWMLTTTVECEVLNGKVRSVINMGTQMLANTMTANPAIQDRLWPHFFKESDLLRQLLRVSDENTCKYVLLFIFNCIHLSPSRSLLLPTTPMGRSILLHLLQIPASHPNFDITLAIFHNMISLHLTPEVLKAVCLTAGRRGLNLMTPEHVHFLRMLDGMVEELAHSETEEQPNEEEEGVKQGLESLGEGTWEVLGSIFARVVGSLEGMVSTWTSSTETSGKRFDADQVGIDFDGIGLILCILGRGVAPLNGKGDTEGLESRRRVLRGVGLLDSLVKLLHLASKVQPARTLAKNSTGASGNWEGADSRAMFMLKVDAVKVVANMCFGCRESQDEFRHVGGIPVLLNHCQIDDANPFIKEWSLFALRNVLDSNLENQALIAALQPQGIAPDDGTLAQAGMKVELDESGKVRIGPAST